MNRIRNLAFIIVAIVVLHSCGPAGGDFPGSEYVPDMAHSIAYESNVYINYKLNTWDSASTVRLKDLSNPRLPVSGTVPRGYAGIFFAGGAGQSDDIMSILRGGNAINAIAVPLNGSVPYYYEDTEADRQRATAEILDNPFPITTAGLARGKELYDIYCGICHGPNGDGLGYLVRDPNPATGDAGGLYPAQPANLIKDSLLIASNGRYYHAIIYGKNLMGAYADKLSYEERWQVIHYIRSLQAKELKVRYDEEANEMDPRFGVPAVQLALTAGKAPAEDSAPGEAAPQTGNQEEHQEENHE